MEQNWEEIVEKIKQDYKKIGAIPCPVFNNDPVLFQASGFKHFFIKRGKTRPRMEQQRRIDLFKHVPAIISSSYAVSEYREIVENGKVGKFWELSKEIDGKLISVVIRQIDKNLKHFFSVKDSELDP